MPYKVQKLAHDKRNTTCGFKIPNGGFYEVVEMTFENHKQLWDISMRPGWSVDYVEGPLGMFDAEGYEIDPYSFEIHNISKQVMNYQRIKEMRQRRVKQEDGKFIKVSEMVEKDPVVHVGQEREQAIEAARNLGLNNFAMSSTQRIKDMIGSAGRPRQTSLGVR